MSNKSVVGALLTLAALSFGSPTSAQTGGSQAASQPPASTATPETRPATTTTMGDTGLWFVPTGEILPAHDNAREETRRLNLRAALVVRLQR